MLRPAEKGHHCPFQNLLCVLQDIPHLLLSYGDDGKANSSTPPVNTGL